VVKGDFMGDFMVKLETSQPFICNRFLQFWPGGFRFLSCHIGFGKTKWGCLNQNLSYESSFFFGWRLVPQLGGGAGQGPAQGLGAAGVSAGDCGVSDVLQAFAAAGDAEFGALVHGGGGGAAAVEPIATGGLEGGIELVFHGGTVRRGTGRQRPEMGTPRP
jgi:hypothetical protein